MSRKIDFEAWDGCFPAVADAVKAVHKCLDRKPKGRKKTQLATLFTQMMAPAWVTYAETIPAHSISGKVCRSLWLKCPTGTNGFARLDNLVKSIARIVVKDHTVTDDQRNICLATIDTLRDLLQFCDVRAQTKYKYIDPTKRQDGLQELCRFCDKHTELVAARISLKNAQYMNLQLSGQFCAIHKRRLQGGEQNPAYRRELRRHARFKEVLKRLQAHNQLGMYLERKKCGPVVSDFYSLLMAEIDPVDDVLPFDLAEPLFCHDPDLASWEYADISLLRKTAREIVELGITENWMKIIAFKHAGLSDSEVARQLGITRQALWSTINSKGFGLIPKRFRFDKRKTIR